MVRWVELNHDLRGFCDDFILTRLKHLDVPIPTGSTIYYTIDLDCNIAFYAFYLQPLPRVSPGAQSGFTSGDRGSSAGMAKIGDPCTCQIEKMHGRKDSKRPTVPRCGAILEPGFGN